MSRLLAVFCVLSTCLSLGCSMCASPYDCAYAAYGGIMPRANQFQGRVGSILDPAEVIKVAADPKVSEPTPAEIPGNSGEITASPLGSEAGADESSDSDFSVASDVEEVFDPNEEFEPFGDSFGGPANANQQEKQAADDGQEPDQFSVIDAEPLDGAALEPTSVDPSEEAEVEKTGFSTLRLLDAGGNEIPISE